MEKKNIRGVDYLNLSNTPLGKAIHWLPEGLQAQKVVFLPDLNPGNAPLPTGSHISLDTSRQPKWQRLAVGDIGCGMQVRETNLEWTDFQAELGVWDSLMTRLRENGKKRRIGSVGGGNHFVVAAVDDNSQVHVITHTGSARQSAQVAELIDRPEDFDTKYAEVVRLARDNRDAIGYEIEEAYGPTRRLLDIPHNFYLERGNEVLLYKGAMALKPGQPGIIPSSMTGEMALVEGTSAGSTVNYAVSHGTGRVMKRSESRIRAGSYDFDRLREKIYIPKAIRNESLTSDNPDCYRQLDPTLDLLGDLIKVTKRLVPIAYLGQF